MKVKTRLLLLLGLVLVAGGLGVLVSYTQLASSRNHSQALHDKLVAVENSIPSQAGKTNYLKQSDNLTKSVDPELVDLDSQIITVIPMLTDLLLPLQAMEIVVFQEKEESSQSLKASTSVVNVVEHLWILKTCMRT